MLLPILPFKNSLCTTKYSSKGFTLVELVVVIAIIATISGFIIPNFSGYIESQNLRQAQDQVKTDLRTLQLRALNGQEEGVTDPLYWGAIFLPDEDHYRFFVTANSNTGTACSDAQAAWLSLTRSKTIAGDVLVRNTSTLCIFFSFENGDACVETTGNPYVSLDYAAESESNAHAVSVNGAGNVYILNGEDPLGVAICP